MSKWHGGKGSKPRPIKDLKQFDDNWDAIFGKKDTINSSEHNEDLLDGDDKTKEEEASGKEST